MINNKFFLPGLYTIFILGGLLTFYIINEKYDSPDKVLTEQSDEAQVKHTEKVKTPSKQPVILDQTTKVVPPVEAIETKDPKILLANALKDLSGILPTWMDEKGMRFEDSREIFGHTVLRSRARHQWEGGKQMEIEISDIGVGADESVIKALGFNLEMGEVNDESGLKIVNDDGEILTNYEYDYADQAGSLQVLYGERYIIEIQTQGLPEEVFQEILDQDISFDDLYQTPPLEK